MLIDEAVGELFHEGIQGRLDNKDCILPTTEYAYYNVSWNTDHT